MTAQNDADLEGCGNGTDQSEHVLALFGIQAVGRLIEQDERRVVGDRLGQFDPLALAGAHRPHRAESFLRQTDKPQGVAGPGLRFTGRQAVEFGDVVNEVGRPNVAGQCVVLGCVSHASPDLMSVGEGVDAEDGERAGADLVQTEHHPEKRGLPRAVGAEQSGDTGRDGEADVAEGGELAVPLCDRLGGYERLHHRQDYDDPRPRSSVMPMSDPLRPVGGSSGTRPFGRTPPPQPRSRNWGRFP